MGSEMKKKELANPRFPRLTFVGLREHPREIAKPR
jgi:hypothetical protein